MNKIDIVSKSPYLNSLMEYPRPCLIKCYDKEPQNSKSKAIIICTGGGYCELADEEGWPAAKFFYENGYTPFILCYSLGENNSFPVALVELAQAVSTVRKEYSKYNVDSNDVIVMGLSAGGHLASSLGAHWNSSWLAEYGVTSESKPDRLILAYPVTGKIIGGFGRTFHTLKKNIPDTSLEKYLYVDENLTESFPPCFIWHNIDDQVVPIYSTLNFITRLKDLNLEFETHFFPSGGHRLHRREQGLNLAINWLKK